MQTLEAALDEYESKIGLPKFTEETQNDSEVKKLMSLTREQMEKMSLQDCGEAAIMLGGFSFHLQRCQNRESSRAKWADSKLKSIISGKEGQYKGCLLYTSDAADE